MRDRFDNPPSRSGSHSIKWDKNDRKFGRADLIPLWIADMDFESPPAVVEAIQKRASHGIFGYSYRSEDYVESIINWLAKRHGWQVDQKDLLFYPPGTVSALNLLVNLLTQPSEEVIVQTPSYPPLMNVVKNNQRKLLLNSLVLTKTGYKMDLAGMENLITDKTKLMLLCSPHNPSGRVWRKQELTELARLCQNYGITIVSDEVHADLVLGGISHTHLGRLDPDIRPPCVTIISSCKTFNLAGLPQSTLICDTPRLKRAIQKAINHSQVNLDGIFSAVATQAAYQYGADWVDGLLDYLRSNRKLLIDTFASRAPRVKVVPAQGTYLGWLDFRELGIANRELQQLFIERAGVGLYNGCDFGEAGEGFFRINLACSQALLEKALVQICDALDAISSNG